MSCVLYSFISIKTATVLLLGNVHHIYDNLFHGIFKAFFHFNLHLFNQTKIIKTSSVSTLHILHSAVKLVRLVCPVYGLICIKKISMHAITEGYCTNQFQRQCKCINGGTGKPCKNASIKMDVDLIRVSALKNQEGRGETHPGGQRASFRESPAQQSQYRSQ